MTAVTTAAGAVLAVPQASGSTVTFDGVSATITDWTNTTIKATTPTGGTTGDVVASVDGVPSAGVMFTYTPVITSLSPIPVLADGVITIQGNYFGASLTTDVVTFNVTAATVNSWTNTSIVAVVPGSVTAGTVKVSVNGVASNAFSFSLTSPYTFSLTYAPDGDVLSVKDNVNGTWSYTYDGFNRLLTSNCSANCPDASSTQGFSYGYDRYNRWNQTLTAGSGPQPSFTFNGPGNLPNNRIDGPGLSCVATQPYCYDAAGNLLNDGNHSYTYDAENRIIQVDQGQTAAYVYNGGGQRIEKTTGAVVAQYLHDLSGNTITEVNGSGVWTRGEIYAGGRHLATYGGGTSGTTYFIQQDWLGTERARVLPDGDLAETCTSALQ